MKTECSNIYQLHRGNFKDIIEAHPFVIVDFWAEWCVPCMDFMPVFDKAAAQYPHIAFAKAHADTTADVAAFFNVKRIPALLAIRECVVIDMVEGQMNEHELAHHIQMWGDFDMTHISAHFDNKLPVA